MTNNQIALRISGTKERKAGFAPLVMSGVLPRAEEVGLDRAMTGCQGLGFIVKHTPDYSFYMAIDGKVRSFDAAASGVLTIALAIPAGMKFADGKTPYDLLMELYSLFVSEYMTETGDGRHAFRNTTVESEPFKAILNRYQLVPAKSATISMNPGGVTGKLNVPGNKMKAFFKDSHYPEFKNFKDIEVGDGLQTSIPLQDLKIPRPVIYKVYVNGKVFTDINASDTHEFITAQAPADNRYYYIPFKFNLKELVDNGGFLDRDGSQVILDPAGEKISCELRRLPVKYTVVSRLGNGTHEQEVLLKNWLETGAVALAMKERRGQGYSGYRIVSADIAKGQLELTYDEAISCEFEVSPNEYDNYLITVVSKGVDIDSHELNIDIKLKKLEPRVSQPDKKTEHNQGVETISGIKPDKPVAVSDPPSGEKSNPVNSSSRRDDKKMHLIFGILLGLVIGFGIGYCVERYVFSHEPTEEQIAKIRDSFRKEYTQSLTDSIRRELESVQPPVSGDAAAASAATPAEPVKEEIKPVADATAAAAEADKREREAKRQQLEKEALNYFNESKMDKFLSTCSKDPSLEKYKEDGKVILVTLFTTDKTKRPLLRDKGYLDRQYGRGDASRVTSLSQLKQLRMNIETTLRGE